VVVCQVLFRGHSGRSCAGSAASAGTGSNVSQCYSEDYAEEERRSHSLEIVEIGENAVEMVRERAISDK